MKLKIICVVWLAIVLCVPGCGSKSGAPGAIDATSGQLALRFQALNVGKVVAADRSVPPLTLFEPKDKIIASVLTRGVATDAPLSARLIAMTNGQVMGEQGHALTAAGPTTTNLEFPRSDSWPVGRYVVEVTLNGKLEGRQEIEVTQNLPH